MTMPVLLLLCALATPPPSANAADSAAANPGADAPTLLSPTLGRPVFVEPGGVLRIVARIPGACEPIAFELVRPGDHELRYRLEAAPDAAAKLTTGRPLRLIVPAALPRQTYNLEIVCDDTRLVGRHCVAIEHVGRALRLVHLSNMNVGDVGAPQFDQRLIDEVNLVAPTLIVATGDYLDATHADQTAGWQQLVDHITRFEAPVIMACGDHDDIELYSRHVAPSPIGLVDVGPNRGLILFDHPRARIQDDSAQLRWVEHALTRPGFDGMTFVVTHDECPNLLHHWDRQGTLARMIQAGRIGLWLAGGHRDWDGQAFSELTAAASPMVYLRTHQSSTAPREGATGVSHYRIIDITDDRVVLPQPTLSSAGTQPSTPVGHLRATIDDRNDGSRSRLNFAAFSNLPYRLDGLALTLRLRKVPGFTPWCHGARLEQVINLGKVWECRVRFDLPDKGGLHAAAGAGREPPPPMLDVRFEGPATLRLSRQTTPQGLTFLSLANDPPLVHLRNNGERTVSVSPLVRLDGDPLAYRPASGDTRFATAYRLGLRPGETVSLQLDLSAVRVEPGRREFQVYLHGIDVLVPFCHLVNVVVDG